MHTDDRGHVRSCHGGGGRCCQHCHCQFWKNKRAANLKNFRQHPAKVQAKGEGIQSLSKTSSYPSQKLARKTYSAEKQMNGYLCARGEDRGRGIRRLICMKRRYCQTAATGHNKTASCVPTQAQGVSS